MKLIVAVTKEWGIGCDNCLLFELTDDLKFFKNKTQNKVIVMGRKTLYTFPNHKPLKNRTNILLTRDKCFKPEGVTVLNSFDELFEEIKKYDSDDVFLVGGGDVYNQLYPYCTEALVTKIDACAKADTFLHNFDEEENWEHVYQSETIINNGYEFSFNTYKNKNVREWAGC